MPAQYGSSNVMKNVSGRKADPDAAVPCCMGDVAFLSGQVAG